MCPVSLSTCLIGFMVFFVLKFGEVVGAPGELGVIKGSYSASRLYDPGAVGLLAIRFRVRVHGGAGYTKVRSSRDRSTDIQSWLGLATYADPSLAWEKKSELVWPLTIGSNQEEMLAAKILS